jgi:hypothetical protein
MKVQFRTVLSNDHFDLDEEKNLLTLTDEEFLNNNWVQDGDLREVIYNADISEKLQLGDLVSVGEISEVVNFILFDVLEDRWTYYLKGDFINE